MQLREETRPRGKSPFSLAKTLSVQGVNNERTKNPRENAMKMREKWKEN